MSKSDERKVLACIAIVALAGTLTVAALAANHEPPNDTSKKPTASAGPSPQSLAPVEPPIKPTAYTKPGASLYVQLSALWGDRNVAILPISTNSDGALEPPDDPQIIGWWNGGVPIGSDHGRALMTGHTVHTGGGTLDDLEMFAVGDPIVVMSENVETTFRVTSVDVLSKDELAAQSADLFRQTGSPGLAIVTCEDWNGSGYDSNVVVIAERESQVGFTHG